MKTENLNDKLLKLYSSHYTKLSEEITAKNKELKHKDRATNPLLLSVDSKYVISDFKVMIFGQETNTWLGEENNGEFLGDIEPVYQLYKKFYLSGKCYSYGGQFWNGVSRILESVESTLGVEVGAVWNNVLKIGRCGKGAPFASIQDILFNHFNVINEEIEILKPDLLLFLSGPDYDGKIKRTFGNLNRQSIDGFSERQLTEFNLDNEINAIRTYHPNYLWRNDIDKYINVITKKIKTKAQQDV